MSQVCVNMDLFEDSSLTCCQDENTAQNYGELQERPGLIFARTRTL